MTSATYFLRACSKSSREAIKKGALLIVDISTTPIDWSIVVCHMDERIRMLRLRLYPRPRLEELDYPEVTYQMTDEDYDGRLVFNGAITYIINDARTGEFHGCMVM